jgi:hypothetical protein
MPPLPTSQQHQLAASLQVSIAADTYDVAAARLLDAVAETLGFESAQPSSERQRAFAQSLGVNVDHDSKRVASAKIGDVLLERNQQAIASLQLKPGDRVIRVHRFEYEGEEHELAREFVVSSIQANGRVFFRGGNGQGAWPTQLRKSESAA